MEKGSQWVGMKECSSDTVAIPPIVDRSSALNPSIVDELNSIPNKTQFQFLSLFYSLRTTIHICIRIDTNGDFGYYRENLRYITILRAQFQDSAFTVLCNFYSEKSRSIPRGVIWTGT